MGYLLKEALKTLCGVNQWDYAVFWKIGCQNPTLLIWEECYHAPVTCSSVVGISGNENSGLTFEEWEAYSLSATPRAQSLAEGKSPSLINKMMLTNRVKVVGQGLVGRAAFTGNHLWILSDSYTKETQPPEVQIEVGEQFSTGIKTLAVIPIFTHGVVQFGSSSTIIENMAFVNDVKNLIFQVGCVPGALLSENYISREAIPKFEIPSFPDESTFTNHQLKDLFREQELNRFTHSTITQSQPIPQINVNNGGRGLEVIPSNPEPWLMSQQPSLQNQRSGFDGHCVVGPSSASYGNLGIIGGEGAMSDSFVQDYINNGMSCSSAVPFLGGVSDDLLRSLLNPTVDTHCSTPIEANERKEMIENDSEFDHFRSSGNDLFDILGSDFKSKLFGDNWNNSSPTNLQKNNKFTPDYHHHYADSQGNSLGIFSSTGGTDHLLDAVVSKSHPASIHTLDNSDSCGKKLGSVGGSLNASPSSSQAKLSGLPISLAKLAGIGSVSFKSEKEDSSLYGSRVSSWVEQGAPSGKQTSGGGSKKGDDVGKSNRKRLKPGESPRPRPKDRQMIQDRMKELREIVPNGAKLSIDALLERTIKHMLFLQSVTKHADKLKQTGESKIIDKDGGLVLRDGFEGGRTWACEVGSQNTVCPIIVEDLNPPRQMLVEMLCEQRGLFLEIADIIRGLGLTILKGVMETRNNKIWARFAVEADRDVTRMEIFLSLVHLLEQTIKSIPSSCNGIDNSNMVSLHQVSSIPATGRPSTLQ